MASVQGSQITIMRFKVLFFFYLRVIKYSRKAASGASKHFKAFKAFYYTYS